MLNIHQTIKNNPLVFLFGPTGVGKTELLLHLEPGSCSVVNADSKQVYRHLDIGSAKPENHVLHAITHYLIDIRDPWEQFTVGDFVNLADEACVSIYKNNQVPVICGGTAYYFKHFFYGLPSSPPSDPAIRDEIATLAREKGLQWCHDQLASIDSISAGRIHPSDGYRITRALEVYRTTGKPLSSYIVPSTARNNLDPLIIGLQRDKKELDERINNRVSAMFDSGLEEEIRNLIDMGATEQWPGIQGIGYREFFIAASQGITDRGEIAEMIRKNSRAYAKRQMTFFKSLPNVHWIHPEDTGRLDRLLNEYLEHHR
ncbi:MAG: tRNA (adenosine(37)-N6)-dimethylallyltransferase MiaA [Sphaerochaetaceae bacterium]|nr:tRNA (adenosine(37)-N6)-dimethylallyltransferase MiaA [Sphaerochaetaceae bacterium]